MSYNLYDEFDKMVDSIEEEIETNIIDKQRIKMEKNPLNQFLSINYIHYLIEIKFQSKKI